MKVTLICMILGIVIMFFNNRNENYLNLKEKRYRFFENLFLGSLLGVLLKVVYLIVYI